MTFGKRKGQESSDRFFRKNWNDGSIGLKDPGNIRRPKR